MCVVCVVSSVHVCVNGYLVLTGETDAKLSLFHLAVMGVVVELGVPWPLSMRPGPPVG